MGKIYHLSDLDEILENVRNENSRKYLSEAITSYRAGAYRAATITTWIAVCVDIIEKIRELSMSEDATANKLNSELNNINENDIPGMLNFEKKCLDLAFSDLELISIIEKKHLERLRDDRNICAHPTFCQSGEQYSPSPEITRAYIVHAANYLLIQQPVKGKQIIETILNLVFENSFPENNEKAFIILSSNNYLGRAKEAVIRNLIIIFLKKLFKDTTGFKKTLLYKICAALNAIKRMNPTLYNITIKDKLNEFLPSANDLIVKRIFPFILKLPETLPKLDQGIIVRMSNLIETLPCDEVILCDLVSFCSIHEKFSNSLMARIEIMTYSEQLTIFNSNQPCEFLKNKAIDFFVNSNRFDISYSNGVSILLPHSIFFNSDDLKVLLNGISNKKCKPYNQILDAGSIQEVFDELMKNTNHLLNYNEIWKNFCEKVCVDEKYPFLISLMIKHGIIKIDEPKTDVDTEEFEEIDLPF
ncbi:MAG: hypothetical protein CVV64_18630 [Candidatus Wallbacteria bacterium HGW-Wallbacteria-1]|uniref:Uncharacterized protein n=1 Tax=Candidatus Wallbacteria bacterium HGW-Wallbacteria-1 TaxID=2013854 RepID=A0A2N1PJE7_9BACT|nr:MAG: hypothetical protein CVV64_18630 [Candidatus Wallbacteria bacterium HGW-Wallbacteria-1]